ncbi:polysulfide reductase [Nitriliruptoraceae bacterium ZYF776]|nr:polysulfide reductase [Profundirhabdus halotolerans]
MAGTSSVLAAGAAANGNEVLAQRARWVATVGAAVSPPLLIADLGRPSRFLNMLRVFKPTSAMSVGSWILAGYSAVVVGTTGLATLGRLPRLRAIGDAKGAVLGLGMATYTGTLVADTSIPVWHEARRELPPLFAASGLAAAGAASTLLTPADHAGPARRSAVAGAVAELAIDRAMRRRLGEIGEVYEQGVAGRFHRAAEVATAAGAALVAAGGRRRRALTVAGSVALLAGSICQRWSVYKAGFASALDPVATVKPQRERLDRGEGYRKDPRARR